MILRDIYIYKCIYIYIHYIKATYVYYHILILHITYSIYFHNPRKEESIEFPNPQSERGVEVSSLGAWTFFLLPCQVPCFAWVFVVTVGVVCIPGPKTVKKPSNCQIKVLFKLFWRFPSPNVCNYK